MWHCDTVSPGNVNTKVWRWCAELGYVEIMNCETWRKLLHLVCETRPGRESDGIHVRPGVTHSSLCWHVGPARCLPRLHVCYYWDLIYWAEGSLWLHPPPTCQTFQPVATWFLMRAVQGLLAGVIRQNGWDSYSRSALVSLSCAGCWRWLGGGWGDSCTDASLYLAALPPDNCY